MEAIGQLRHEEHDRFRNLTDIRGIDKAARHDAIDRRQITDSQILLALLAGIFTVASLLSVGLPLIEGDALADRMKLVASERERIRAREREKLAKRNAGKLRPTPKAYMKEIVDKYSLSKWLGTEDAKAKLTMAGFRGRRPRSASCSSAW